MLSWMLYSILVSLLMGLSALALERSAQIRQRPARWVWAACLLVSVAIPFIPGSAPVQILETTAVDRVAFPEITTPAQTTAIEPLRFTLPAIGTDEAALPREVSALLEWICPIASTGLALVILAGAAHCGGSAWRLRSTVMPGFSGSDTPLHRIARP